MATMFADSRHDYVYWVSKKIWKSTTYSSVASRLWGLGEDTHEIFGGGACFIEEVLLCLDEPDLEVLLDVLRNWTFELKI